MGSGNSKPHPSQLAVIPKGNEVERLFYEGYASKNQRNDKDRADIFKLTPAEAEKKRRESKSINDSTSVPDLISRNRAPQSPACTQQMPVRAKPERSFPQEAVALGEDRLDGTLHDIRRHSAYLEGEERWKERARQRIADRIKNDARKSMLVQYQLPSVSLSDPVEDSVDSGLERKK